MTWHSSPTFLSDRSDLVDPYTALDINTITDTLEDLWDNIQELGGNGTTIPSTDIETIDGDLTSLDGRVTTLEGSSSKVDVRQTVLSSSVDSNGYANYLSAGAGLSVTLDATPTAVIVSFAAGYASTGAIDYIKNITSDQTFSSLTASDTNYLYLDLDGTTLTTGKSLFIPVYSYVAPGSPSTDQHWFNLSDFKMYRYSGSAWENKKRVFVGEAVTDGSSVTSVITYANRGQYISAQTTTPAAGTNQSFAHNLGTDNPICDFTAICIDPESDYVVGDIVHIMMDGYSAVMIAAPAQITRTGCIWRSTGSPGCIMSLTGNHIGITASKWELICRVMRGW